MVARDEAVVRQRDTRIRGPAEEKAVRLPEHNSLADSGTADDIYDDSHWGHQ